MNRNHFSLFLGFFLILILSACDPCADVQCQNGGSCVDGSCVCPAGFSGPNCETDDCASLNCINGGTCVAGVCNCPDGFEGVDCAVESRGKVLGSYSVTESCNGQTFIYSCNISQSPTDRTQILFSNFYDINNFTGSNIMVYGQMTGSTTFSIPSQDHTDNNGSTWNFVGTGTFEISDNSASLSYNVSVNATTDNCTADYQLQ